MRVNLRKSSVFKYALSLFTGFFRGRKKRQNNRLLDQLSFGVLEPRKLLASAPLELVVNDAGDSQWLELSDQQLTLREAVFLANQESGPSEIVFADELVGTTIRLDSQLTVSTDVNITADNNIILSGENQSRVFFVEQGANFCLLYTSPSPRDRQKSRMPSSA